MMLDDNSDTGSKAAFASEKVEGRAGQIPTVRRIQQDQVGGRKVAPNQLETLREANGPDRCARFDSEVRQIRGQGLPREVL
jgi:hypothetical protein